MNLHLKSPGEAPGFYPLVTRGKQLAIASFLGPDEKESFARELGNALAEARRGPARTVFN